MHFTRDTPERFNLIRSYGNGEVRINDDVYRGAVLVSAASLLHEPTIRSVEALLSEALIGKDALRITELRPEMVLLGTGLVQVFPPATFAALFLGRGIGLEVMTTGAACRTYNVLLAEGRRVAAALLA